MKRKALCGLHLLFSLALFAIGPGSTGGFRVFAQQIQTIGARQWLGLMAGSVVASTPVLAPVSRRIAGSFGRQTIASANDNSAGDLAARDAA